jgi:proteasome lid subunit RPN8/RPN11
MKQLDIIADVMEQIHLHGEGAYPEEGAGLMLGEFHGEKRCVIDILPLTNSREDEARHNRYLISAEDMYNGEIEAMRRGLDVIGVFHSHPDHPDRPSEFDREWAMPWFSYVITSVQNGQAVASRSWRLTDDRAKFEVEKIKTVEKLF